MRILHNITTGNPRRLTKSVLWGLVTNFLTVVPFAIVLDVVRVLFQVYANPGTALDTGRLYLNTGIGLGWLLIMYLAERRAYRAQYRAAYETSADGRIALAEKLRRLPLGYLSGRDPGDLATMIMGNYDTIETAVSHLVPQLIGALVFPIIIFLGMAFLDWRMALAMFAALPVTLLLVWFSTVLVRTLGKSHMRARIDAGNRLQEYLNGIRVIKANNLIGERFARLEASFRRLMRESIRIEALGGPVGLLAVAFLRAGLTIMTMVGVYLLLDGSLNVVTFLTFLVIGGRVFDPLTVALINYMELRYAELAGERILNLMAAPEMPGTASPPDKHDIEFQDVSFGYNDEVEVIHDVSFRIPQGSMTAFVGPSGSGKSTMFRLLSRFYDPQKGRVLLGGVDARTLEPEELYKKIAMVFQDVYLFQDTVANNIRFGKRDATQAEIEEAAKRACCHDFITRLPQGYDTMVGEGGCTLSGGEKQRISIARALLKKAPVVLLDEATASLDPENELEVQRAIDALVEGRTIVVIAHALKTVCGADNIIVLDEGRIVEQGRHEELLEHQGLYEHLWTLQQESQGWVITA